MCEGFVVPQSNVTVPVGTKDLRAIIGDTDENTSLGGDDEGRLDVLRALESTVFSAKEGELSSLSAVKRRNFQQRRRPRTRLHTPF